MRKFFNGLILFLGFSNLFFVLFYTVYGLRCGFTEIISLRVLLNLLLSMCMFEMYEKRK